MRLKLKMKMLLLVVLPLLCLAVVTYVVGSGAIMVAMTDSIEKGMKATAISIRDAISLEGSGDFWVDEQGDMWKGDLINISQSTTLLADEVKGEAGMEVTVFFGDTRYMTSVKSQTGERPIGTKAAPEVTAAVLGRGEYYFAENVDVAGEKFFACYVPLYNDGSNSPVGMVFTGISQDAAEAVIHDILMRLLYIILGTVLVLICVAWVIANNIVKGIRAGVSAVNEVSKGNLTVEIDSRSMRRKDEVGDLSVSVAKLKKELVTLISKITEECGEVYEEVRMLSAKASNTAETVAQVGKAVEEVATGATFQAQETQTATEHIVAMGNMVEDTNAEVGTLAESSNQIKEASDAATMIMRELGEINEKVMDAMEVIYKQTNTTNESALKIREATDLITSIAEETSLLSLNATIEAARAGAQGRGFAVVAGQIQKLAEQSDESARQIESIIKSLLHDSEEAVETMDGVREIIRRQTEKVHESEETFSGVKAGIDQSIISIQAIADQTEKLDQARAKVVDGVQNLSAIAQQNAASTQETAASVSETTAIVEDISASAGQLKGIADELQKSIGQFRL